MSAANNELDELHARIAALEAELAQERQRRLQAERRAELAEGLIGRRRLGKDGARVRSYRSCSLIHRWRQQRRPVKWAVIAQRLGEEEATIKQRYRRWRRENHC